MHQLACLKAACGMEDALLCESSRTHTSDGLLHVCKQQRRTESIFSLEFRNRPQQLLLKESGSRRPFVGRISASLLLREHFHHISKKIERL